MLTKIFKWLGIFIGSLFILAVVLVGILYASGTARMTKKYDVQPESLVIPTDQAAIEQGKKWAAVLCADCHGADFSGQPLVDDEAVGFIPAPNLTPGEGGAGSEFTDADWMVAVRQGIDPHEGRSLVAMPSMNFAYMTDRDLGALIAYLKSVPPVDHDAGESELTFMGKLILASGGFGKNILPAEVIDHQRPKVATTEAVNVSLDNAGVQDGGYLVRLIGCRDCHGEDLTGGKSPEPGAPFAPDLTSSGIAGTWSFQTFTVAVHTNKGDYMPWIMLKPLDDAELEAIFTYLQSLPGK